jgi:putative tricarboxylic transport membrane protein
MQKILLKISIISIGLSVSYFAGALSYSIGTLAQPGPGLYPLLVGVLLILASVGVFTSTLLRPSIKSIEFPKGRGLWQLLFITAVMIVYAVALPYIGHLLAAAIVVFGVLQAMGLRQWYLKIGLTVALSLGSFYLFDILLKVPLPRGWLLN